MPGCEREGGREGTKLRGWGPLARKWWGRRIGEDQGHGGRQGGGRRGGGGEEEDEDEDADEDADQENEEEEVTERTSRRRKRPAGAGEEDGRARVWWYAEGCRGGPRGTGGRGCRPSRDVSPAKSSREKSGGRV